jgi:hypothetical protein
MNRDRARLHPLSVDVRHALRDLGQQFGRIEPPERPLGDQQESSR